MGILRADRITGLGGANAITGSVFFPHDGTATPTSGALQVQNVNDALTFGTGDFTIEFWFYTNRIGVTQHLYDGRGTGAGSNAAVLIQISDSNNIRFFTTSNYRITGSSTLKANTWYHIALTRTGSTHTLYVNGSSDGTYSASNTYLGPTNGFSAIGSDDNGAGAYGLNGYISNLRVSKELVYSAAFTVPTTELAPTPNTTLLCCQSPGNVNASFGDCILTAFPKNINSQGPVASRFTPNSPVGFSTTTDVGSQYGSTFDGFGSFATSTYMVPPGGNTRERNRGRAVFGGGYAGGPSPAGAQTAEMSFLQIQSQGNSLDFGDLTAARWIPAACSSSTRGTWSGGATPTRVNTIDFVTIANTSNATDFGDLTGLRTYFDACSNQTRGITGAGDDGSTAIINTMDLIIIATAGNATDFGDATAAKSNVVSTSSPTRGLLMGGYTPDTINNVDFITIATTGNAQDFGDMTAPTQYGGGSSSNTRAIYAGGYSPNGSTFSNKIEFFTIASTGNGTDFGDLITARITASGSTSNSTRGVIAGGMAPSPTFNLNSIEFYTIATTGNAQDFGDITNSKRGIGACSDSHGGLS